MRCWQVIGNFMYPPTAVGALVSLVSSGLLDQAPVRVRGFSFSQVPEAIAAAPSMRALDLTAIEM